MIKREIEFAPPWLMYPHLKKQSMGWRMGYGEGYINDFEDWYGKLGKEEKYSYVELFPEPFDWAGWYEKDYNLLTEELIIKPVYTRHQLKEEGRIFNHDEIITFWGHQVAHNASITKSCLSQWWQSEFKYSSSRYFCSEQFMMAVKARLFGDKEANEKIMLSNNPKEIKLIGRDIQGFSNEKWDMMKYDVVFRGNYEKFIQNSDLKNYILETGNKLIIEASPVDNIWGVGLDEKDERILNPKHWRGENLLGFALMHVRSEIRRICCNSDKIDFDHLHKKYD